MHASAVVRSRKALRTRPGGMLQRCVWHGRAMGQLRGCPCVLALLALHASIGISARGWGTTPTFIGSLLSSPSPNSANANPETCLAQNLHRVLYSCPSYNASTSVAPANSTGNMRDAMIKLLQSCLLSASTEPALQNQSMKVLAPIGFAGDAIQKLTSVYQATTGIQVQIVQQPIFTYLQARTASINNPANRSVTHDAWLITTSGIGDGVVMGAFMDLSQLVLYDQKLQWQGIIDQVRLTGLVYGSKVIALPLSSGSYNFFYRVDTFTANNWTVPKTWRELADMAAAINGTNNMWGFCAGWGTCGSMGQNLLRSILASYHQTLGATHGWLIDPDTMHVMFDTPATLETLEIIQTLYKISPPDNAVVQGCAPGSDRFSQGICHMTLAASTLFKYISFTKNAQAVGSLQGNLGAAISPGSATVLDRTTNTLVPCTPDLCPYASWEAKVAPNGSSIGTQLVNFAPSFDSTMIPLNAKAPDTIRFYAYSVISYLMRPDVSSRLVFDNTAEVMPTRTQELEPSRWQAAGYNLGDATRSCRAHGAALSHPNMHVQIRIPGASSMSALFGAIANSILAPNASIAAIFPTLQPRAQAVLNSSFNGNQTALKIEYWSSINRKLPPPPGPTSPSSQTFPATTPPANGSGASHDNTVIITVCVVVPAVALLSLAAVAARAYMMGQIGGSTWRKHPGPGPDTTLLVTDIENSTSLWEELDANVMEQAGRLHDTSMRKVMGKHKGYETFWEGDSFVVAFPTPLDALNFALEIQKTLLNLDWPAQLLASERAEEVWVTLAKSNTKAENEVVQAALQQSYADFVNISRPTWASTATRGLIISANNVSDASRSKGSLPEGRVGSGIMPKLSAVLSNDDELKHALSDGAEEGEDVFDADAPSAFFNPAERVDGMASAISHAQLEQPNVAGHAIDARRWCQRNKWAHKWVVASNPGGSATLVLRGLRVRIGFHAGLTTAPEFNKSSRRYLYSGAIRIIANAVAFAGHGGFILMSSSTAERLGMDSHGALRQLPSDCHVYHMGNHTMADVPGEPTELLMVLPAHLKCLLAIQQTPLRTMQCVVSGVLDAPASPPARAKHLFPEPVLAAVLFSGLNVLLSWNREEAVDAIRAALKLANQELHDWQGVMSEDGLSLILQTGTTDHGVRVKNTFRDVVTPGRMVAAFHDAAYALRFALALRHRLLTYEWNDEIMAHEMCEQVGVLPEDESEATACAYRQLSATADASSRMQSEKGNAGQAVSLRIRKFGVSNAGSSYTMQGQPHPASQHHPASLKQVSVDQPPSPLHRSRSQRSEKGSQQSVISSAAGLHLDLDLDEDNGSSQQSSVQPTGENTTTVDAPTSTDNELKTDSMQRVIAPVLSNLGPRSQTDPNLTSDAPLPSSADALAPHPPLQSALRKSRPGGPVHNIKLPPVDPAANSGKLTESFVKKHLSSNGALTTSRSAKVSMSAAMLPSMDGSRAAVSEHSAGQLYAFDAAMLRGIRVRMVLVSGPSSVHVAVTSSGRASYRGPAVKQLHKLLRQAHAGQVLVTGKVMQLGHIDDQAQLKGKVSFSKVRVQRGIVL